VLDSGEIITLKITKNRFKLFLSQFTLSSANNVRTTISAYKITNNMMAVVLKKVDDGLTDFNVGGATQI